MLTATHRAAALLVTCLFGLHAPAQAQDAAANFPNKAVRFIVSFAPGGGTDLLGRIAADHLSKALGQPFVVENRPGAGGMIAARAVLAERPDGHTILVGGSTPMVFNPLVYSDLGYDRADLVAVTILGTYPMVIAGQHNVAKDMKELIESAKKKGGHMTYGHPGAAAWRAMMEAFNNALGIKMTHVPYKSAGQALPDVIAGNVQAMLTGIPATLPHLKSGRVRVLGIASPQRLTDLPDIPTVAEGGFPGFESSVAWSLFSPAGTPPPIINRIQADVARALTLPDVRERFATAGLTPIGSTPAQLAARLKEDQNKWPRVIREAGIKVEP